MDACPEEEKKKYTKIHLGDAQLIHFKNQSFGESNKSLSRC